jgi:chromate transport protein ChrA
MGGVIGAILARFLVTKYDNNLSGNARSWYKKGILVGKQQYSIAKPICALLLLLAVYAIIVQQQTSTEWLVEALLILVGTALIFLEKPKFALVVHLASLIYPFWQNLEMRGLPGLIPFLLLFQILFDISLLENPRTALRYGGISKIEREKIKEYLEKEEKS